MPVDWRTPPEPVQECDIQENYQADVVIVGAGHSGVAAARTCAENGLSVLVIETMKEQNYWAYGIDFGHINSKFLEEHQVPHVDELAFFRDWQLRSGNRSNPKLVMQFAKNSGECFDWFLDALSPQQQKSVQIRFWPAPEKYPAVCDGIRTWVGCATFPEALWNHRGITEAVVANIKRAKEAGAEFHFSTKAMYLEKHGDRVSAVIGKQRHGGYVRFSAKCAVVLAAGDFAHNEDMMQAFCQEQRDLLPPGEKVSSMLGRDGSGICMGLWAGGRMVPGPIACMGGNIAPLNSVLGVAATLWLDGTNQRYCNEGFAGGEFAMLETARQPAGIFLNLFDHKVEETLSRQVPGHGARWGSNPDDPFMKATAEALEQARRAGATGYDVPYEHGSSGKTFKLYAANTISELCEYLGYRGELRENLIASVMRYNAMCRQGRDEDFGKEPALLVALDTPPYYAAVTDRTKPVSRELLVTVDGLWTNEHQQVYDPNLREIPGLYATGNCCGRRFGIQYSTPVSGVSIGMAWTLGRELGKWLAQHTL